MSDDDRTIADRLTDAAERLPLPAVPSDVSRRLRDTYRASLPTVPAELVADTRRDDLLIGSRGGPSHAWTMSFRAGSCDIVLDLVPQRRTVRLSGQLLCPEATPGATVRVFRVDELVTVTTTDEFGQFEVGSLHPDEYTIAAVRAPSHVIELDLDLRSRPTS